MPPRPSSYNVLSTSDGAMRRPPLYSASSNFMAAAAPAAPPPPLQTHEDGYDSSDWFDPPDGNDDNSWVNGGIDHDAREGE